MKKVYLPTLLFLAACKFPHQQPFAIDQRVTVELPGQPHPRSAAKSSKLQHPERMKIWLLNTLGGTYHLLRAANPTMHIAARDTLEQEAYYNRKIVALKKRKAQLIACRPFSIAGVKGRDLIYRSHASTKPVLVYSRDFVLDSVGYTLNFFPTSQEEEGIVAAVGAEQRRHFFNSITVKP